MSWEGFSKANGGLDFEKKRNIPLKKDSCFRGKKREFC
jgi:hypothetical protein